MNRLKEARINKGLTVRELANLAKVSPTTITLIENDKRPGELLTLRKLAIALEIDWHELEHLAERPNQIAA